MRIIVLILATFFSVALVVQAPKDPPKDPYAPLRLYDGTWNSTGQRGGKPTHDHIVNICRQLGLYFACEQTVNGKVGSLVIYVPAGIPGQYHLQAVLPQGFATGRSDLTIDGDLWIYSSKGEENGRSSYYRTTNRFHGPGRIHYELQQSPDGQHWTTTGSGDEVHLSTPAPRR